MEFTNKSSMTKAVRCGGGYEVLRPNETKNIDGDFTDGYLAALDKAGVKSSSVDDAPKKKKRAKKKAKAEKPVVIENVEMTEDVVVETPAEVTETND